MSSLYFQLVLWIRQKLTTMTRMVSGQYESLLMVNIWLLGTDRAMLGKGWCARDGEILCTVGKRFHVNIYE